MEPDKKAEPKELGVLNVACSIPRKIPTDKQAGILIKAEGQAKAGFHMKRSQVKQ